MSLPPFVPDGWEKVVDKPIPLTDQEEAEIIYGWHDRPVFDGGAPFMAFGLGGAKIGWDVCGHKRSSRVWT